MSVMNQRPIKLDDEYGEFSYPVHTVGTASGGYGEEEPPDPIRQLHDVVKEVTGKEVQRPAKPRIGFLP